MNSQKTNTNTNKMIAFAIVILLITATISSFVSTINLQFKSKADNITAITPTAAPTAAPIAISPAETPTVKATTTNPTIAGIKSNDTQVTGTAAANATIELKDGNGNVITCKNSPITSDANGNYSCQLNTTLPTNTIVSATATESGKNTSSPVNVSVSESTPVLPPSSSASSSSSASASTPAFSPFNINGGLLQFNIPDGLKNALGKNQYNANLSLPNLGDWTLKPGAAITGLAGMVPILAQKDDNNYLSTFLSNQTPEIANKPTTRIVLDQQALDAASGVAGFKPVEVGGLSDLVRIPNLSTPATDDWWYVPKSSIEPNGYKATANDVANVGKDEATIGFYKGNILAPATPAVDETLPYSFILEGTPKSFSPGNAFALNGKASTPENLLNIDNLVRGSTFDNITNKFALPKINLPKISLPGFSTPAIGKVNGWNWWWILPLLLLLALLAFLWWLLRRLFGWGVTEDTSKYSTTYTGTNNNFKKTNVNYQTNNTIDTSAKLKSTYSENLNIQKTSNIQATVQTPKYVAPTIEEVKYVAPVIEEVVIEEPKYQAPKFEAPKYEAPKYVAPKYEEPKYVAPVIEEIAYVQPKAHTTSPAAAAAAAASAAAVLEVAKKTYDNTATSTSAHFTTHTSRTATRHSMHRDDLKIVEGIGPVIEKNLHDAGVLTYQDLANTTEAQIEKILAPITNNFTVFNCSTWAEQAQLAADGKFDELEKLKDELDKGVRR